MIIVAKFANRVFIVAALCFLAYGLAWNFSTRRYLRGFADAIVPLSGSPEEKTEALIEWFHHEPERGVSPDAGSDGILSGRDPVNIVQNQRLLKVCGTASNAFVNLAVASGLKVRRLLLLDPSGSTMHVVAEVQWGDRWVVVNPQQGLVFRDQRGRGLSKEELRNPAVFHDAISRMPGYSPTYTFERTVHIRLARIPLLGNYMRRVLDRFVPGWEEATNWGYLPENPALLIIVISFSMLLLTALSNVMLDKLSRSRRNTKLMTSQL